MPLGRLLELAIPLADALSAAHEARIVHRDLKPANIMVMPDGRPKVLDFGLAKLLQAGVTDEEASRFETLAKTQDGVVMGTVPYMSPEQVEGHAVDHRTDVFSLGVLLYEMAVGRRPFAGSSSAALMSAILRDTPRPVDEIRPELPGRLARLVSRCLEKKAVDRLPSARDVLHLRVAARTSSFAFKGRGHELASIAEKLHVAHVLAGSLRRSGTRLRVTAQLVDVMSGFELWSERYERELVDVFAIQDEIAAAIAEKLMVTLGTAGPRERRRTSSPQAYDYFLQGLAHQRRRGRSILQAIDCFERAVELDPGYAEAHAYRADSHRLLAVYALSPARESMPSARAAAELSLALDPNVAEAHATLAYVASAYDRDDEAAGRAWERALTLDPQHVRARAERAMWHLMVAHGRMDEAVEEIRRASESDPLNAWAAACFGWVLAAARRHEEGIAMASRAIGIDGESMVARWALAEAYLHASRYPEAAAAAEGGLALSRRSAMILGPYAAALARSGKLSEAQAIYAELCERTEYVSPTWISAAALAAGRRDDALSWLERAVDQRDPMVATATVLSEWDPIRTDPRFRALMERLTLPRAGRVA